jgi:hypothetical protein
MWIPSPASVQQAVFCPLNQPVPAFSRRHEIVFGNDPPSVGGALQARLTIS